MDKATVMELQLSRALGREIQWVIDSGGVMPVQIRKKYDELKAFYDTQIANEEYKQTTLFPEYEQTELFS